LLKKENCPLCFFFPVLSSANPVSYVFRDVVQQDESQHADFDFYPIVVVSQSGGSWQTVVVGQRPVNEGVGVFVEAFEERFDQLGH